MKIGLNSMTFNNDVILLQKLLKSKLIQTFECTKKFYLDNKKELNKICNSENCETFSSLITNNYDLKNIKERKLFVKEFKETCKIASNLGCSKLMFGMARFRNNFENSKNDILNLFKDLIYIAKTYNLDLLYEAISDKDYNNEWIKNHYELINYTSETSINKIHIDFGTIKSENEDFGNIIDECVKQNINIANIHYPFGDKLINEIVLCDLNISLENYTKDKLSSDCIIKHLENLQEFING